MEWDFWTWFGYFYLVGLPLIGLGLGVVLMLIVLYKRFVLKEPVEDLGGVEYEERDECIVPSDMDILNCPLWHHAAYDDDRR